MKKIATQGLRLLDARTHYKPMVYPWAFDAWDIQQKIFWIPDEISLASDVLDWNRLISKEEKNLLTQIFRFFTQADTDVHDCYVTKYLSMFKHPEVSMMLTAFANMETIHMAAYAYLLDTVGMDETEYMAFTKYKEMSNKHDYLKQFNMNNHKEIAKTLAVYGAFTEGLQLFASFIMLLNFPRFNKMKGMGQIITFSIKDETLHTESIIKLFKVFSKEYDVMNKHLENELYEICDEVVKLEECFIDLSFEMGDIIGLTRADVKKYVRYIANRRLIQLDLKPIYNENLANPLPWVNEVLNATEHTNFFENKVTEYSRGATKGTWDDAFEGY